jgi:hypothetical protein
VFRANFRQSNGVYQDWDLVDHGDTQWCNGVKAQDDHAWGRSPKQLDSGAADGQYAFCNTKTGVGC